MHVDFSNIKVGDLVLVRKGISCPYVREVVCEVNDIFFKCEDDNTKYSIENGHSLGNTNGFPFAINYDEYKWIEYCQHINDKQERLENWRVISEFYNNSRNYKNEEIKSVADFIRNLRKE